MRALDGEQVLMRIFVGESDRWHGRPLHHALVERFREEGVAGATVVKGLMGYGAHSVVHTADLVRLSSDLPVVVEVVDASERIDALLPILDEMVDDGLVTLEKVRVIRYRPRGGWPEGKGPPQDPPKAPST